MVTVFQVNNLKYKVNQRDHNPPHVHVEGLGASVRINLLTLEVMDTRTEFSEKWVKRIVQSVAENREALFEKWMELHGED